LFRLNSGSSSSAALIQRLASQKFKSMMSDIATKLAAAAGNEAGGVASSLEKIAEQFRKAAGTGTTDPQRAVGRPAAEPFEPSRRQVTGRHASL
jgi:hypothetical protein